MLRITEKLVLSRLPLILAGPILRRVEGGSVTVWMALRMACQVELRVFQVDDVVHDQRSHPRLIGSGHTVALGKAVHIVAVTAQSENNATLIPGELYAYDLEFTVDRDVTSDDRPGESISLQQALRSSDFPDVSVSYFDHGLPTFALSPLDLNDLRLLHGSCRKVHDRGIDALPIVDQLIAETADQPNARPHQLFFTGDQIYGDEVADPFLWGIQQVVPVLFGWTEPLICEQTKPMAEQLQPGERQPLAESAAGLTASCQGDQQKTNSHLFSFSEYCTSYLFSWSECLWALEFPRAEQVGRSGEAAKRWNRQLHYLNTTAQTQPFIRRALANVPTYMIFDDHDVSDDWNLNQAWCLRVFGKPLGRQIVRNALLAYSLFQAWGNTPAQFSAGKTGARLLHATRSWCEAGGEHTPALAMINQAIGMPMIDPLTDLPQFQQEQDMLLLKRPADSLQWHYRVRGAAHEVIVLDTRTQRGYPLDKSSDAPPQLISSSRVSQQLQPMLQADCSETSPPELTFVVAPTNVFTLEILDYLQALGQYQNHTFDIDIGDSWNLEGNARPQMLKELFRDRQQVILLSGDIHFGAALRLDYWHQPDSNTRTFLRSDEPPDACLVQLIASAICNSESVTEILHTKLKWLLPERTRYWVGELGKVGETEITPRFWRLVVCSLKFWFNWKSFHACRPLDWAYRSQWLHRAAVQPAKWQASPTWLRRIATVSNDSGGLWQRFWDSRWWQEGPEVVGLNNIGLVQLYQPADKTSALTVIYDLYWYAPWQAMDIVYSRFQTELYPHMQNHM